ncbi:hypothetical protein M0811_00154 [Anaeramoeba ignava]|uniref:NELF-A N-terminal domain-containing protein n=1 Tax=Anaeramoeba ignava TaxID=1746090 RepID=A0A9Q0LNJ6_ANAIG|nr:hypothetical protein M0811_00154 [Anaeramoeba ignava]
MDETTWNTQHLASQLTSESLPEIQQQFSTMESQTKIKTLLALIFANKREMNRVKGVLLTMIETACKDKDEWVRVIAEIVKPLSSETNQTESVLNIQIENDKFQNSLQTYKSEISKLKSFQIPQLEDKYIYQKSKDINENHTYNNNPHFKIKKQYQTPMCFNKENPINELNEITTKSKNKSKSPQIPQQKTNQYSEKNKSEIERNTPNNTNTQNQTQTPVPNPRKFSRLAMSHKTTRAKTEMLSVSEIMDLEKKRRELLEKNDQKKTTKSKSKSNTKTSKAKTKTKQKREPKQSKKRKPKQTKQNQRKISSQMDIENKDSENLNFTNENENEYENENQENQENENEENKNFKKIGKRIEKKSQVLKETNFEDDDYDDKEDEGRNNKTKPKKNRNIKNISKTQPKNKPKPKKKKIDDNYDNYDDENDSYNDNYDEDENDNEYEDKNEDDFNSKNKIKRAKTKDKAKKNIGKKPELDQISTEEILEFNFPINKSEQITVSNSDYINELLDEKLQQLTYFGVISKSFLELNNKLTVQTKFVMTQFLLGFYDNELLTGTERFLLNETIKDDEVMDQIFLEIDYKSGKWKRILRKRK